MNLAADTAAIFADPHGPAVDAVYTDYLGQESPVRVIPDQGDAQSPFGAAQFVSASSVFSIRVEQVPQPRAEERLTVAGAHYRIQGQPVRNARRLLWRVEARPE